MCKQAPAQITQKCAPLVGRMSGCLLNFQAQKYMNIFFGTESTWSYRQSKSSRRRGENDILLYITRKGYVFWFTERKAFWIQNVCPNERVSISIPLHFYSCPYIVGSSCKKNVNWYKINIVPFSSYLMFSENMYVGKNWTTVPRWFVFEAMHNIWSD